MTNPVQLLAECEARGVRLLPEDGGGLSIDAPEEVLTPDLLGWLKRRKAELLALLTAPAEPCPRCRCAIFLLRDGRLECGNCRPAASGETFRRLLVVDDPEGRRWADYDEELRRHENREAKRP